MSALLYPSDLFKLRRDVRDYCKAAGACQRTTHRAEWIAIRAMCSGTTQADALTHARSFLWSMTQHGYSPRGAA